MEPSIFPNPEAFTVTRLSPATLFIFISLPPFPEAIGTSRLTAFKVESMKAMSVEISSDVSFDIFS